MEILSRDIAKDLGLKRFFTGEPCKNGHHSERATKSGNCVQCNREKSQRRADAYKVWYEANHEHATAAMRARYQSNPEEYKERNQQWVAENPERNRDLKNNYRRSEKGKEQSRDWVSKNKEKHASMTSAWKAENPDAVRAYCRGRQAMKLRATPPWQDLVEIKPFYAEAVRLERLDGVPRHVDHIVPLQGENVCGLHVPWNLQILTEAENCAKGNRHD